LAASFLLGSGLSEAALFTRVEGPSGFLGSGSNGAAWGDYDRDGDLDLFVVDHFNANSLFQNNGSGGFTRVGSDVLPAISGRASFACAWADYDNDGDLDLVVSRDRVGNVLYLNTGQATFTLANSAAVGDIATTSRVSIGAAWGDFDGDGWLDLFVANGGFVRPEASFMFRNHQGLLTNVAVAAQVGEARLSQQGAWSDFDNDGDLDLFVTRAGGQGNALFRNDEGVFTKLTGPNAASEAALSLGAAWGDYDNDGDLDLFVTNNDFFNGTLRRNLLYRNRGDGTFEKIADGDIANDAGIFTSCAWADYDNDGWLDLFVCSDGGLSRLYRNNGDGTFTSVEDDPAGQAARSIGCAWGDYDGDGFLDLFVANGSFFREQENFLYHNEGNANAWLKVKLTGTASNRSAIGAKVRLKATVGGKTFWQMREISGGSGYLSQNALDASFGLGDASVVETLRIEWPSGTVQEFHQVDPKQSLVVVESAKLTLSKLVPNAVDLTLRGGRNRRYRLDASTNLTDWAPLARLMITNLNGMISFRETPSDGEPRRFYRAVPSEAQTLVEFLPSELPEGLAVDSQGNAYVSMIASGEIRKIAPDGTQAKFAQVPPMAAGMAADAAGNLFVAVSPPGADPNAHGIWRISPDGAANLFAGLPTNSLPNDVVLDAQGNLFVTDSIGGGVFKILPDGQVTVWTTEPLLFGVVNAPQPHPPFPIGANGLAFTSTDAFVSNTDRGTLIRIPIQEDGAAGKATLFLEDPRLLGADGVVADLAGNLYIANIIQSTMLRVTPHGRIDVLADARDGLDGPSSLRFGTRSGERAELFFVNYAFVTAASRGVPKPSLMKLPLQTAGVGLRAAGQ
jgi:sugar lactone lactonase YvrE